MNNDKLFYLIISGIVFLFVAVYCLLRWIDYKSDYSGKKFPVEIRPIDGKDYLVVPYAAWQIKKLEEIKKRYKESYHRDGKQFKCGIVYERMPCNAPWILLRAIHKECRIELIYSSGITMGNTNVVYVQGDGNIVNAQQNISNNIEIEIDKIIKLNDLPETERSILELFKYKVRDDCATKNDADRVLNILGKYVPLATALIELIKSLFE